MQGLAADVMMFLPVFVLAERAAVTRRVAAAAGLTCFPAAVPTTLQKKKKREKYQPQVLKSAEAQKRLMLVFLRGY